MSKKAIEEELVNFDVDMDAVNEVAQSMDTYVDNSYEPTPQLVVKYRQLKVLDTKEEFDFVPCLKNEIIEIRFIPLNGKITDKKHPMSGGLSENSKIVFSVPRQKNGSFVNVLTNNEKKYLEYIMGLEDNALSVYNRVNNYWSNKTEGGISKVILNKRDNRLDLSDPLDYIKYKILLACKDLICPNWQTLLDKPKSTYKFVLISDSETNSESRTKFASKKSAYIEYGKIESNYDKLKTILEMITAKMVSQNAELSYLLDLIQLIIEEDPKMFLNTLKDGLLDMKVLIKKAVDNGIIVKRTNFYYLKSSKEPLCEAGEEATLTVAAKFLSAKKNQEILFTILGLLNKKD